MVYSPGMTASKPDPAKDERNARLAAALRENLKRRKAQARSLQEKSKSSPEEKTGG
ncbi:MAG: hypothetical protein JSR47_19295 [Proteobacteria bacterium]|nr:hypothetical protein [Pseudomonadota bacterium]MBS0550505.1 hypothetical protein [Pseudomonadota bacterium]